MIIHMQYYPPTLLRCEAQKVGSLVSGNLVQSGTATSNVAEKSQHLAVAIEQCQCNHCTVTENVIDAFFRLSLCTHQKNSRDKGGRHSNFLILIVAYRSYCEREDEGLPFPVPVGSPVAFLNVW
jgi:hypothetical protein